MSFPDEVVRDAWELVEGKCECSKTFHKHPDVLCNKHLIWENRGKIGWGGWEACAIDGKKEHNTLSNCEILCFDCRG
jgi:hypothetical protein